jgi:hypothetical protein
MAEFAALERLIGAPLIRPPAVQWDRLESELGVSLPEDYKALADRYASLKFDDFLGWFHPGIPGDPGAKVKEMKDVLRPLRERLDGESDIDILDNYGNRTTAAPYAVYPEPGGVLQWGMTDNGDRCLWLARGAPDDWTIMIERGMWWHYSGGLVEFLIGILRKTVRCPLFPASFPESLEVEQSLD